MTISPVETGTTTSQRIDVWRFYVGFAITIQPGVEIIYKDEQNIGLLLRQGTEKRHKYGKDEQVFHDLFLIVVNGRHAG